MGVRFIVIDYVHVSQILGLVSPAGLTTNNLEGHGMAFPFLVWNHIAPLWYYEIFLPQGA